MGGLGALLVFAVIGGIFLVGAVVFWIILRATLWLVFLPFRLLLRLLFLPLLPIALLVGVTWAVVRLMKRPATT